MELKQSAGAGYWWSHNLSLASEWNWNMETILLSVAGTVFPLHQNGIETDYTESGHWLPVILSLASEWNWNKWKVKCQIIWNLLSLASEWNWNYNKLIKLIRFIFFPLHQNGIETMLLTWAWLSVPTFPCIRMELKLQCLPGIFVGTFFPLHQNGIETR